MPSVFDSPLYPLLVERNEIRKKIQIAEAYNIYLNALSLIRNLTTDERNVINKAQKDHEKVMARLELERMTNDLVIVMQNYEEEYGEPDGNQESGSSDESGAKN